MFRTRFAKEIVAEFLPPVRQGKKRKAIILCDGMPSVPTKQPLAEFLARRGYWVFYPRWRGAWESGGRFLEKSPVEDVADVITGISKGVIRENAFGQVFKPSPDEIFVIGGSFGGATSTCSGIRLIAGGDAGWIGPICCARAVPAAAASSTSIYMSRVMRCPVPIFS